MEKKLKRKPLSSQESAVEAVEAVGAILKCWYKQALFNKIKYLL